MVFVSEWRGEQAVILQNSQLIAVILPDHGGKVASLYLRSRQFELLFQNPKQVFQKADIGSDFSKFEACGLDDAFPTIDPCKVSVGGFPVLYPDHGEIWSSPLFWELSKETVELTCTSRILPYRYEKTFSLQENALVCNYKIQNTGKAEFPYLWAFHCLVNCERGMRLIYPNGATEIVYVLDCSTLGKAGEKHDFRESLHSLPQGSMSKYYISSRIKEGRCGYYYPKGKATALIEFDPEVLPYLGFWCTTGGYRGDINCAFEPATGYYDNALRAFQNHTGSVLHPNEILSFRITVTLSERVCTT